MSHTFNPLDTSVQFIKGVGPAGFEKFKKKNILTFQDLVHFYPRKYYDQQVVSQVSDLIPGQYACIQGEVFNKKVQRLGKSSMYQIIVQHSSDSFFLLKYFKLPYRGFLDSFEIGQNIKVCGVVHLFRNQIEFHHPEVLPLDHSARLLPIYSEIEGLSQQKIRQTIKNMFMQLSGKWTNDVIPENIRQQFNLLSTQESLVDVHIPEKDAPELYLKFQSKSQQSLIFEELFRFQLYLGLRKLKLRKNQTQPIISSGQKALEYNQSLPFKWTSAQEKVYKEIVLDLNKKVSMRRLLQGDVGCGKTSVAFQVCCYAMEAGFQTTLMVPTEILAEQHFETAQKSLPDFNIGLLTSKVKNKKALLEDIKNGTCQLCIGTQALIQEGVQFKNLGLVIIDEQHRFGVYQRDRLSENKHCLVMTATPIPRTLAMTLYADLDISVIDEMPSGRPPIVTRKTKKRRDVFLFLEKEILKGRQAYIVYPLIEESEKIDLKNAKLQFEKLKEAFPRIRWGLLHGKMSAMEKSKIMEEFVQNKIQALVTTTVIEVGIDVPNATMMVVEHSERFGLSQLHQLRGRVGRGQHKSYCILILGEHCSPEAFHRVNIMEQNTDGFSIAEEDLKFRGAGELMGRKQSGLIHFKLADIHRDIELLKKAQRAVQLVIDEDVSLNQSPSLKLEMENLSHI